MMDKKVSFSLVITADCSIQSLMGELHNPCEKSSALYHTFRNKMRNNKKVQTEGKISRHLSQCSLQLNENALEYNFECFFTHLRRTT